jgi:hypothetical protein
MNGRHRTPDETNRWRLGHDIRHELRAVRTQREVGNMMGLSTSAIDRIEVLALAKVAAGMRMACGVNNRGQNV